MSNLMSIDSLVTVKAQEIALRWNASSVSYNVATETYTYYCPNDNIHRLSRLELRRLVIGDVNKKIYGIK